MESLTRENFILKIFERSHAISGIKTTTRTMLLTIIVMPRISFSFRYCRSG